MVELKKISVWSLCGVLLEAGWTGLKVGVTTGVTYGRRAAQDVALAGLRGLLAEEAVEQVVEHNRRVTEIRNPIGTWTGSG